MIISDLNLNVKFRKTSHLFGVRLEKMTGRPFCFFRVAFFFPLIPEN